MLLRSYLPLLLPIAASASTFTVSDRGSAFASLHVKLEAGETMQSEPGALVRYSGDLRLRIRCSSGWLGRIFAGEDPWTTSISATSSEGECMLCPQGIGDIKILELASDEAMTSIDSRVARSSLVMSIMRVRQRSQRKKKVKAENVLKGGISRGCFA